jgi:response regulator RpfG family c-di-GMP phosphodiesterase
VPGTEKYRVLLVDDERNVLDGYRRQLRKSPFILDTADSGQAGLDLLQSGKTYAVVVSDMRMPGMNGIEFLQEVRRHTPDTVLMMLTGNADMDTCINAINEGHIFRFMNKPCPPEDMAKSINAGIEQYRLITSEKELLHGTLTGAIRTLTDILGIMNPPAFSRGARIRRYVRHIVAELNIPHFWEYEMAATLCMIGCVALPPEILARINTRKSLTSEQRGEFAKYPLYGGQLLAEIPRLEMAAEIIMRQNKVARNRIIPAENMSGEQAIALGAQMIRLGMDLDLLLQKDYSFIEALNKLHSQYGPDHPLIIALMSFETGLQDRVTMTVHARELSTGMLAAEDITTTSGQILLMKGQRITAPLRYHLQSCAQAGGLKEPFAVEVVSND